MAEPCVPRTEEGKNRSSLNAFRHGLTGQIVIHTPEDRQAFQMHCDDIRESLAPLGALETTLAQSIAEDYWRLNRARALENAVFTLGLQKNFGAYDDDVPNPEVETALALGRTWTQHGHGHFLSVGRVGGKLHPRQAGNEAQSLGCMSVRMR